MDEGDGTPISEVDKSSSENDSSESETELMVTSRARRATAGNRYSTLVAQEEPQEDEEDEVTMLFAEGEGEDEDFNSDEGDEDADMSSSDDDDQGPNAAVEDLEGEKEIQKEAKVERAKKRKADLALTTTAGIRKKPRIDPTALRRAPAPKPSKRKERVSWLVGSNAAPGRTSLRKQTILHRAETHAKLKENEEQRLKLKAKREKREREKEAEAPKQMTQADRLAEAERIERRNAKSLNRWEAMEKKRAEEQAARLAALKERKLEGPVLTWCSSRAKYFGLKENTDVASEAPVEGKRRGRKPKALLERLAAEKLANTSSSSDVQNQTPDLSKSIASRPIPVHTAASKLDSKDESQLQETPVVSQAPDNQQNIKTGQAHPPQHETQSGSDPQHSSAENPFLTGIHEYASMQSDAKGEAHPSKSASATGEPALDKDEDIAMRPALSEDQASLVERAGNQHEPNERPSSPTDKHAAATVEPSNPVQSTDIGIPSESPSKGTATQLQEDVNDAPMSNTDSTTMQPMEQVGTMDEAARSQQEIPLDHANTPAQAPPAQSQPLPSVTDLDRDSTAEAPTKPPIEVISTRNLVALDKFDELSDRARNEFSLFYNTRTKATKPVKHSQEFCPITGLPARYRDPATGIAYANALAYKKLQELRKQQFTWSSMLGCYVGRANTVARGVPEGFLGK